MKTNPFFRRAAALALVLALLAGQAAGVSADSKKDSLQNNVNQAQQEYNQAQQVVIPLPAQVCDGSVRGVKVVCGGQEYTAQLTMPFEKAESSSAPVPKTDSTSITAALSRCISRARNQLFKRCGSR